MKDTLNSRELEVISLYASGLSGKEIAEQMNLSIHSIRNYSKSAKFKTGAKNITQLAIWCYSSNLLEVKNEKRIR